MRTTSLAFLVSCLSVAALANGNGDGNEATYDYELLATNKTSTMEKELNETAERGFHLEQVMGGETSWGGSEVVAILSRRLDEPRAHRYQYRLLATSKTSTMQKELDEASREGFVYKGQTVFDTAFGGEEVVVILERDLESEAAPLEYRLLASKRTGTMQKELKGAGEEGYAIVGLTVAKTAFGGEEIVSVLARSTR